MRGIRPAAGNEQGGQRTEERLVMAKKSDSSAARLNDDAGTEKIARLRALRLAKEAADRAQAQEEAAAKAAAKAATPRKRART
jgi:hypothetical protein